VPVPAPVPIPAPALVSVPEPAEMPAPADVSAPAAAPAPMVAQMARWSSGPGGSALRASCADLENVARLFRLTADPSTDQVWLNLRDACCCLGADVSMAMTAPPMPDPQAQFLWTKVLAAAQRAATDLRAGMEQQDPALIRQGNVEIQAAAGHMAEMTTRIKAIPATVNSSHPSRSGPRYVGSHEEDEKGSVGQPAGRPRRAGRRGAHASPA
jgi:hypothetical protein